MLVEGSLGLISNYYKKYRASLQKCRVGVVGKKVDSLASEMVVSKLGFFLLADACLLFH